MSSRVVKETGADLSPDLRHDYSRTQPASTTGKRLITCSFLASLAIQPHTPLSCTSPALAFQTVAAPAPPSLKLFLEATLTAAEHPGIIVWGNLSAEPQNLEEDILIYTAPDPDAVLAEASTLDARV